MDQPLSIALQRNSGRKQLALDCPICGKANAADASICDRCGIPLSTADKHVDVLPAGTKLRQGRYTVGRVLGRGGFGVTYLGAIADEQRPVAIKELYPEGCQRHGQTIKPLRISRQAYQDILLKFMEEARLLARFDHHGIVRVEDAFEEHGTAYMVMEYLEGKTLKRLLDERGRLPQEEALVYIHAVGTALIEVHSQGLLHRDIKPENIILTRDGRVVLIDFGTAREFMTGQTRAMTQFVTPGYAPLEQRSAHGKFGPFTDIYALGATLFHMLVGRPPPDSLDRIQGMMLPPVCREEPTVSYEVATIVMSALALKANLRPQTAHEFLSRIQRAAGTTAPAPLYIEQHPAHQPKNNDLSPDNSNLRNSLATYDRITVKNTPSTVSDEHVPPAYYQSHITPEPNGQPPAKPINWGNVVIIFLVLITVIFLAALAVFNTSIDDPFFFDSVAQLGSWVIFAFTVWLIFFLIHKWGDTRSDE